MHPGNKSTISKRMFNLRKSKIYDAKNFLRLTPFNTATPEGRASERKRRVMLTAFFSTVSQGVKILVSIISVSLLIGYLGNERYGMWLTISSIIAFVSFADLGVGNGLLNAISEAAGNDDKQKALQAISSALLMLSIVALILGVIFALVFQWIPWGRVFNVSSSIALREAGPAIAIFASSFLIGMPLAVTQKTQIGYQEGYWNDIWLTVGNVLGLIGIIFAIQLQVGTPELILVLVGAPVVALFINGLVLFGIRRPWLRPKLSAVSSTTARQLATVGIQFFVLQIAVAVGYTSDRIVIAQVMGAEMVPQFGVPQRLFLMVSMVIGFVLVPLWPAYGEALAKGDFSWIKATLTRTVRLTLLVTVPASFLLVVFGGFLIDVWVGQSIQPTFILMLGLGLWTVISSVGNAFAMFLNGMGMIRIQVILAIIMAVTNLALSILLTFRIGVAGPVWGSVITYTVVVLIPITLYLFFFKLEGLEEKNIVN